MDRKQEEFSCYLQTKIAECKKAEEELKADERLDEAVFQKVRQNVYEIFSVVYQGTKKRIDPKGLLPNDELEDKMVDDFKKKLENIPKGWKESLSKAREFQDEEKIYIEELKLSVLKEIEEMFEHVCKKS